MKILITGGSGLLGKSLLETKPKSHEIALTYLKNRPNNDKIWYHLDIRKRSNVFDLFEIFKPNIVIHCAAIGGVDYTDQHYQETREVNVTGLANVIDAAKGYHAKIAYISTNAVYGGNKPPYDETSPLEPVNSYGIIKREAEALVKGTAWQWLIFRPFMLYGWPYSGGRTNWAKSIIQRAQQGERDCKLVDDVIWQPTYAKDCAEAIWKLLFQKGKEIYNVASPEKATLYEFGLKVCDVFDIHKSLVKPVSSDYFPSIAKRPKNTSYDLSKLKAEGIELSDIRTGLQKMKKAAGWPDRITE